MQYIKSYKDAFRFIKADYNQYSYHGNSLMKFIGDYMKDRSLRFTFWLRLSQHKRGVFYQLARLVWKHYSDKYCIDIRPETKIGMGLRLPHGMCVVVNEKCVIGKNVRLYQNVTIGVKDNQYPSIGDNSVIYPNSVILGGVRIGDDSIVGAGSIVLQDVENNSVVAGNPAKTIALKK